MTVVPPSFRFSSTYLFKIHALKNALDRVFDEVLRKHAHTTLSQFTLLLAVSEHKIINQRKVASFLWVSPAAVNRQAEIAQKQGLLEIADVPEGRGQALALTDAGKKLVTDGIQAVDMHLAKLFVDENRQLGLMEHIELLLSHAKGGSETEPNATKLPKVNKGKGKSMGAQIPKARKLYRGDINAAVIQVQKLTGVHIDPKWWDKNVGNSGTSESILDRFDVAYERDFGTKIAELATKKGQQ